MARDALESHNVSAVAPQRGKKKLKKIIVAAAVLVLLLGIGTSSFAAVGLGAGARYHVALKNIPGTSFEESHLSFLGGLRLKVVWFILDADLDYRPLPQEDVIYSLTPKLSFLVDILGTGFYAGAGLEKTYMKWTSQTPEWSDLTYVLQVGREMNLGPLSLVLDAYYESLAFSLKDIDTKFITFGARLFWYL